MGTVAYASPEQIQEARYADARSDQYALGLILYECVTGVQPFRRDSMLSTLNAIATASAERPSALVRDVPEALDAVIARAMCRDAGGRFPSLHEFRDALHSLQMREVAAPHPAAPVVASGAMAAESLVGCEGAIDRPFVDENGRHEGRQAGRKRRLPRLALPVLFAVAVGFAIGVYPAGSTPRERVTKELPWAAASRSSSGSCTRTWSSSQRWAKAMQAISASSGKPARAKSARSACRFSR